MMMYFKRDSILLILWKARFDQALQRKWNSLLQTEATRFGMKKIEIWISPYPKSTICYQSRHKTILLLNHENFKNESEDKIKSWIYFELLSIENGLSQNRFLKAFIEGLFFRLKLSFFVKQRKFLAQKSFLHLTTLYFQDKLIQSIWGQKQINVWIEAKLKNPSECSEWILWLKKNQNLLKMDLSYQQVINA
jgi:hypothetical protein